MDAKLESKNAVGEIIVRCVRICVFKKAIIRNIVGRKHTRQKRE